ncbi:transcriptional regulatory protein [Mycobacteroides abscessus subsp. abscessus]|uniref:WhiB family transcriptional regulator n=1 Tax=Mycobacteroides abscessus TaxID=36809 RepID=UPI0009284F85|nr:WhiB family transcriptional regulator [Mycobacteroides abscessus]SIL73190.1 transcriptional regulatory protein [Mycobacteroides abscessus subsp. abscessus]
MTLAGINLNDRTRHPIIEFLDAPDLPDAACKGGLDTDWGELDAAFFPNHKADSAIGQAKAICETCPVKPDCLREVLAWESVHGEKSPGVWGGLDEWERQALRDRRAVKLCRKGLHELTGANAEPVKHLVHAGVRCRACRLDAKRAARIRKQRGNG